MDLEAIIAQIVQEALANQGYNLFNPLAAFQDSPQVTPRGFPMVNPTDRANIDAILASIRQPGSGGSSFSRAGGTLAQPNIPTRDIFMPKVEFLPGMWGTINTTGIPKIGVARNPIQESIDNMVRQSGMSRQQRSDVGGIFPATLVDYYKPALNRGGSLPTRGI